MKVILSIIFATVLFHTNWTQQPEEDILETLKEEAKGLLYSDPNKSYDLLWELDKKNQEFYEQDLIDEKTYEEFQGDINSGKGNYFLIANGNVDSAFYYYNVSIKHYKKANDDLGVGTIYNNKGVVLEQLHLQDSALKFYDSAIIFYKVEGDLRKLAKTYGNIGNIYIDKGNYPVAQKYFLQSYDCALELQDTLELAYTYFGLGNIANLTKNTAEAENYFMKALEAFEKTDDLYGLSSALFSMGNVYKSQLKIDSAYFMYHRTLATFKKAGYSVALPQCHINLAVLFNEYYDSINNFSNSFENSQAQHLIKLISDSGLDSAKYHANQAIKISKEVSKIYTLVYGYISYGTTENLINNYTSSLAYADSANHLIEGGSYVNESKQIAHLRYSSYKGLNNYKEALKWHEVYINLKDSLYNIENAQEMIQQQFQFDYDKKAAKDSVVQAEAIKVKNAEIAAEQAENAKQKSRNTFLIILAAFFLIMGVIIFQRLRLTQRQKRIIDNQKKEVESQKNQIELQHHELEETHREISDSIRYAQRLQGAILPDMDELNKELKDGFVLFKPKDVVSGDFYWMQPIDSGILIAAADCTGHGVPGAMVSVVCSNALNRSVNEFNLKEPADILNQTRDLVIETFASSSTDVKDGMDIALCKIEYKESGANLTFAGANNPLWVLRKDGTEIEEIKGAKQPIGKYENHQPFPQHQVELFSEDSIYIFSDGYADQFGGVKGKKMKVKPFKDFLVKIKKLPMEKKKQELLTIFNQWKGDFEQVDDVTVIGIKIS